MAESSRAGLLDLEKELNCSICTEVLYQPLTLLDCLHTFCGSCLKLWFAWQASQSASITCPSCRAVVRGTRPDAKITTLLEMFLQANPDKKKSEEEKKDIASKYTSGEDVMPKERAREDEDEDDETDRRMIEEVREMSLRDGGSSRRAYERGVRHRERSRDPRHGQNTGPRRSPAGRAAASSDTRSQARHIEHQSSLRSLISTDDVDSAEMEEEILRQILEEGLLDGIDLRTMSTMQEDELSERIADAYRTRHGQAASAQDRRPSNTREAMRHAGSSPGSRDRRVSPRQQATPSHSSPPSSSNRPSSSRLQVQEPSTPEHSGRRRASGERRRQTSPVYSSRQTLPGQVLPSNRSPGHREAARSATDLTERSPMREGRTRRLSDYERQARRDADFQGRPRRGSRAASGPLSHQAPAPSARASPIGTVSHQQPAAHTQAQSPRLQQNRPSLAASSPRQIDDSPLIPLPVREFEGLRPAITPSTDTSLQWFTEPSINCDVCGKPQIQYDLYENCAVCKNGNYNLCHRCYRAGKGCHNWFGFGHLAWHRYQRQGTIQDPPHALIGHRYVRPREESKRQRPDATGPMQTTEDPTNRLQIGSFCSICHTFAEYCFWMCDWCNDGEWGYCNRCVNQGRCCTHPLLPLSRISAAAGHKTAFRAEDTLTEASLAPLTSASMVQTFPPTNIANPGQYRPLTFSVNCDICRRPILPNQSRYHCYQCSDGDYDVCSPCYASLVESGRISRENGHNGWRRCLKGHRMVVVFFEDSTVGQRRIIAKDLVGGHFLKDDELGASVEELEGRWKWLQDGEEQQTRDLSRKRVYRRSGLNSDVVDIPLLQQFPPDGGVGMKLLAAYSWMPTEGVTNELSFPRGAEIREAMEISQDWYLGSYAGAKGLFPSNFAKLLGYVQM